MKVLFLDIDGVLNTDGGERQIEPHLVERLNKIMPHVDALVISSSWRMNMQYGDMTRDGFAFMLFTHGVARMVSASPVMLFTHGVARMVSASPVGLDYTSTESRFSESIASSRPRQINDYIKENGVTKWAVLDDMPLEGVDNFVRVDSKVGLSDANVSEVLGILGAQ